MTENEKKLEALFQKLVPSRGRADTVAGEIVRAVYRIDYRFFNDGDHIGVGYGKETCNPAARYLIANTNREIGKIIDHMWGDKSDRRYKDALDILRGAVIRYLNANPKLFELENGDDMLSYENPDEDVDNGDDYDY